MPKYVYTFGKGQAQGSADMKDLLGGKGAGLAGMSRMGLAVPPGFTISTEAARLLSQDAAEGKKEIEEEIRSGIVYIEEILDCGFNDEKNPLLVSVRSGAKFSMPGMMDTVLNLGLNDETVRGLVQKTGDERFAFDSYRRFIQMYAEIVMGLEHAGDDERSPFEVIIDSFKKDHDLRQDTDFSGQHWQQVVDLFKQEIKKLSGSEFPADPLEQLWSTIMAVCQSWDNPRAKAYRKMNRIPDDLGTAINIQAMVFGNIGDDSGTGVLFTRNPATGQKELYGEYLMKAQGEDVVAGIRTPQHIANLKEELPAAYDQLEDICQKLEKNFKDMQDIEFTIQQGKVWMLQTRTAKRTGRAALKIATDMVDEGLISIEQALLRVDAEQLNHLLRPVFCDKEKKLALKQGKLLARGLPAGPGAACGQVVFSPALAEKMAREGKEVILVRIETSPEDIKGMDAALGILTARGGMTSHAALVSRQMGKVCVVGCEILEIDYKRKSMLSAGQEVKEGEYISIDGSTGEVITGQIGTKPSEVLDILQNGNAMKKDSETFAIYSKLMTWADEVRTMKVRANADQPDQASTAIAFGAQGIGLCRTEHMFFGGEKIRYMREMILADDVESRELALAKLLPIQREDFLGIFRVMQGRPVTIRTLDPPLHEFLPHTEEGIREIAKGLDVPEQKIKARIEGLKEINPMLGHRGCRLGIIYSEITRMQTRAIMEAACILAKEGIEVKPEIMIPLVGFASELKAQRQVVEEVVKQVFVEQGIQVDHLIGTMIELPRAALIADQLAEVAEFFSFGTNDLTQTTLGISRDDSGKFLQEYLDLNIVADDPFQTIDREGVGLLVTTAVQKARQVKKDFKIGICGEHGGDPRSVFFCHEVGMDYVSCSPYRLPIARLAAAQAALEQGGKKNI